MGCEMLWTRQAEEQGSSVLQSFFPLYPATRSGALAAGIGFVSSKQFGTIPFLQGQQAVSSREAGEVFGWVQAGWERSGGCREEQ